MAKKKLFRMHASYVITKNLPTKYDLFLINWREPELVFVNISHNWKHV